MIALARREEYVRSLPDRPYCTNLLGGRLHIRDASKAAGYAMIQHNSPLLWRWMVFDLDHADSYFQIEDRGCPPPTFVAINRDNGHAHAAYLLDTPVSAFAKSSRKAVSFYEDVERGLTHKMGADRAYSGFLSKCPLSSRWETDWQAVTPYRLDTLNDYLDKSDKRKAPIIERSAIGRNVSTFDALRAVAYRECLTFKKAGKKLEDFILMLRHVADATNCTFPLRLSNAEIKSLVQSVARWVWEKFSVERFSRIQRDRGLKRWSKTVTLTSTMPWLAAGVSRRTWERKRLLS